MASARPAVVASVTMPTDHLPFPPVRRLGPADLDLCVALSIDRGWSPEKAKWSLLLTASETFGVDAPDGHGLAGTVVLTRWAADYASVGMMLVAARYQRRGLGKALMEYVLDASGAGARVTLFATDMGRPLYEKLGFEPVRRNVSFVGLLRPGTRPGPGGALAGLGAGLARVRRPAAASASSPGTVRTATEADLPVILAADRAAFGGDRSSILNRLPGFADRIVVLDNGHGIAGYAAAWRNLATSAVIGPLVAPDPEAAKLLIAKLAAHARIPVRLDLDPDREELPAWANAHGLEPVARTLVMAHGDAVPRGIPDHLFTPISVALA
jgi:GNAT superfamily N-acetyltransferase